ncbi:MAG: hypothetical protein V4662_27600 [Verrucomicrobiota bacterium]
MSTSLIRYVPTSGLEVAQTLSDALWGLTRPPQVRGPLDTQSLFSTVTLTDGSVWLAVDTAFTLPVHAEAGLGGIAEVLQPWIDSGDLPADTLPQLTALVDSHRGGTLCPWAAFPPFFQAQSQTHAQLVSAGLLMQAV